jgi:hypothetical protein
MYEAAPMHLAKCRRQADGDTQEATQIEGPALVPFKNPVQRLTAWVLKYEGWPPFVTG